MIIDTHVHLDVKKFSKDVHDVIARAKDRGVGKFIIPAIKSSDMLRILDLVEKYDDIYFASGNHPTSPDDFNIKEIEKLVTHEKCVAVGECGLDYFRVSKNDKQAIYNQKIMFESQLELACEYKKPLILHSRDTDVDMYKSIYRYKDDLVGGVIHCYVGSKKLLELEKFGFYFGIGGVLTYNSAVELREEVKNISLERLLLETDAPYLTPAPNRNKRNEPAYTSDVLKELSSILKIDVNELETQIEKNTMSLFFNKEG